VAFRALASGLGAGRNAWLIPLDVTFKTIGLRYGWLKALFDNAPAGPLAMTGRLRAERAAWRAVRRVPAYREYLSAQGVAVDRLVPAGILERLPETDKRSYVDPYPLAERCLDGRIPFVGTGRPAPPITGSAPRPSAISPTATSASSPAIALDPNRS